MNRAPDRIQKLVEDLESNNERVVIPTPALCEFLVLAGTDAPLYLNELSILSHFYIKPFDEQAAVELAAMELLARGRGDKRHPLGPAVPWQKVKVDRQIVAIARVNQSHTIYSDDKDVRALAETVRIKTISSWQLDLPPSKEPLFENLPSDPAS